MEAAALGIFMISAGVFTALLEYPSSRVHQAIPNGDVRRALIGVAMGSTAMGLIYSPWGRRSGAHMNPAVTLSFLHLGKIPRWDAFFYIVFQFLGGLAGVLVTALALGNSFTQPPVNYVVTVPGPAGNVAAFIGEFVIAVIMMIMIVTVSNKPAVARFTGLFFGTAHHELCDLRSAIFRVWDEPGPHFRLGAAERHLDGHLDLLPRPPRWGCCLRPKAICSSRIATRSNAASCIIGPIGVASSAASARNRRKWKAVNLTAGQCRALVSDHLLRFRSRTHRSRWRRRPSVSQYPGPRSARRAMGVSPLLAGRASQYPRHRQCGHVGGHRLCRGRDEPYSRRLRRSHAAQPCAARHRGAVWHAGVALSRADRSRSGARTGWRSTHRACPAPRPREQRRYVSAGCAGTAVVLCPGSARTVAQGHSRRRTGGAALSARFERFQCAPSRRSLVCRSPSHRISRRIICTRRWRSIAAIFGRRPSSRSRM